MHKQYPEISHEDPYTQRQTRLAAALASSDLNALALNPGPSLTYLTGLHFHLSERPIIALFIPHSPVILILPELEAMKTNSATFPVQVFPYGENPEDWPGVFRQAVLAAKINSRTVGVEHIRMRLLEHRLLEDATKETVFTSAEDVLASLRMYKDETEIQSMRQAVVIAQKAMQATIRHIKIGMTEQQLASELTLALLRAGSDPQFPFSPIVSAGLNSANPHATPTDRPLQPGDLLVIDWGAMYSGYISDITRTFAIGKISKELETIAEIVLLANEAGRNAVKPGVPACEVDSATRKVIVDAGYGQFFIHRTGHGIGMEAHEPPYIRSDNVMNLDPGMAFTIEPGIYLPDIGGVRIEDNIVITSEGVLFLTDFPRQLQVI